MCSGRPACDPLRSTRAGPSPRVVPGRHPSPQPFPRLDQRPAGVVLLSDMRRHDDEAPGGRSERQQDLLLPYGVLFQRETSRHREASSVDCCAEARCRPVATGYGVGPAPYRSRRGETQDYGPSSRPREMLASYRSALVPLRVASRPQSFVLRDPDARLPPRPGLAGFGRVRLGLDLRADAALRRALALPIEKQRTCRDLLHRLRLSPSQGPSLPLLRSVSFGMLQGCYAFAQAYQRGHFLPLTGTNETPQSKLEKYPRSCLFGAYH